MSLMYSSTTAICTCEYFTGFVLDLRGDRTQVVVV